MGNQVNAGNQNIQQIGQNPVIQPVQIPEKPKINYLMVVGIILVCFVIFGIGGYYLGTKQLATKNSMPSTNITPSFSPTPSEGSNPTTDGKTYTITTEPTLGLTNYTVKVPASWKQIEHSSNFQDTETFQDTYGQFTYQLVIHQEKNFNEQTGKPYSTLKEVTGFPYDVPTLTVDGQQAAQALPRAGSESDYKVLFFSKNSKLVLSIELDTPRDGSKLKEGETLFKQVLASFKFFDPGSELPGFKTYTSTKYGFSFKYPQDYKVEERVDGFFVITAPGEHVPQGGISIDARLQGIFETYEKAVNYYTTSLELSYNVQKPNVSVFIGVGKEGQIKGIEFQNAVLRYKTGALGLETINVEPYKSIFGTILSNFTINK